MMNTIRIRTEISHNHELVLRNLPLQKGKKVEVIIIEEEVDPILDVKDRFPLRGTPIRFDAPFDSATNESDWEVNQ